MPVTQVPWSASSATIALVNVIKNLVRVAPSAGRRFFANSFFRRFPMSAARLSRRCCVSSGSILIVAVFHTGNGRSAGHIQKMEKLIALTVVIAILVFAATYALAAWSEHR
jgi:hypothetical protein